MSLLDHHAVDRARSRAGLLPTQLAAELHMSFDAVDGIVRRNAKDKHITLQDLGRIAAAVAVAPRDLIAHGPQTEAPRGLSVQLVALLYRDGNALLSSLATRLSTTIEELVTVIHAFNADGAGLKIMRWHDSVGLIPDPALDLPPRGDAISGIAHAIDRMLWQVIDRAVPSSPPRPVEVLLKQLERDGLVAVHAGEWRPTDMVIETLELVDWDTMDLVRFAEDNTDGVDRPDCP